MPDLLHDKQVIHPATAAGPIPFAPRYQLHIVVSPNVCGIHIATGIKTISDCRLPTHDRCCACWRRCCRVQKAGYGPWAGVGAPPAVVAAEPGSGVLRQWQGRHDPHSPRCSLRSDCSLLREVSGGRAKWDCRAGGARLTRNC